MSERRSHPLAGKCARPKSPKPGVTTYFCVYAQGHEGTCSWGDDPAVRALKLRPALPSSEPADEKETT